MEKDKKESHKLPLHKSMKLTIISFAYAYRTNILGLIMGTTFGFLMSRAGATTFDYHAEMFLFIDMQLMKVIVTAVVIAMIGVFLMKKYHVQAVTTGMEVDFVKNLTNKV